MYTFHQIDSELCVLRRLEIFFKRAIVHQTMAVIQLRCVRKHTEWVLIIHQSKTVKNKQKLAPKLNNKLQKKAKD